MRRRRFGAIGIVVIDGLACCELVLVRIGTGPFGEIGCRSNSDQACQPVAQFHAGEQHQPAAHRRSDDHDLSFDFRVDQRQHLLSPPRQGSVSKAATALTASGIIEQQAGPALPTGPVEHGGGLAACHVGHVAGQEDQSGAGPTDMAIGDASPVGHGELLGVEHGGRCRPATCRLQVFQKNSKSSTSGSSAHMVFSASNSSSVMAGG